MNLRVSKIPSQSSFVNSRFNFQTVISKAKTAYENSRHRISDHFAGVGKMVKIPKSLF